MRLPAALALLVAASIASPHRVRLRVNFKKARFFFDLNPALFNKSEEMMPWGNPFVSSSGGRRFSFLP